jgi:hypothetical protein
MLSMLEKERYMDKFGMKNHSNRFPSNGARKLVGIFNATDKSASARIPL